MRKPCFRHWQAEDPESLLQEAQQVRQEFADQSDTAGLLDLISGKLASRLGRFQEALTYLQRVPLDLNFPVAKGRDAALEVVGCYLQMGQLEQAQAALASAQDPPASVSEVPPGCSRRSQPRSVGS